MVKEPPEAAWSHSTPGGLESTDEGTFVPPTVVDETAAAAPGGQGALFSLNAVVRARRASARRGVHDDRPIQHEFAISGLEVGAAGSTKGAEKGLRS